MDTQNKKIDLTWRTVCGSLELEEMVDSGLAKVWQPRNHRQRLFYTIKHPGSLIYTGQWGPEKIYQIQNNDINLGRAGIMWCTEQRKTEFWQWMLDNIYYQP